MTYRLGPSRIHGIGVFTTQPISPGSEVFADWDDSVFIPRENPNQRELMETYCVSSKDGYYCPRDFNRMYAGWYLNHSDTPNIHSTDCGFTYFAIRDIAAGEELTIDYRSLDPDINNLPTAGDTPNKDQG